MYILVQLLKEQLSLVVTQCLCRASTTSDHAQLRPEEAIILQFLRCLGDVTSWDIRLYGVSQKALQFEKAKNSTVLLKFVYFL